MPIFSVVFSLLSYEFLKDLVYNSFIKYNQSCYSRYLGSDKVTMNTELVNTEFVLSKNRIRPPKDSTFSSTKMPLYYASMCLGAFANVSPALKISQSTQHWKPPPYNPVLFNTLTIFAKFYICRTCLACKFTISWAIFPLGNGHTVSTS